MVNKHLAGVLRRGLESKHSKDTALRQILDQMNDDQLVLAYLANEHQKRKHQSAKKQQPSVTDHLSVQCS